MTRVDTPPHRFESTHHIEVIIVPLARPLPPRTARVLDRPGRVSPSPVASPSLRPGRSPPKSTWPPRLRNGRRRRRSTRDASRGDERTNRSRETKHFPPHASRVVSRHPSHRARLRPSRRIAPSSRVTRIHSFARARRLQTATRGDGGVARPRIGGRVFSSPRTASLGDDGGVSQRPRHGEALERRGERIVRVRNDGDAGMANEHGGTRAVARAMGTRARDGSRRWRRARVARTEGGGGRERE